MSLRDLHARPELGGGSGEAPEYEGFPPGTNGDYAGETDNPVDPLNELKTISREL